MNNPNKKRLRRTMMFLNAQKLIATPNTSLPLSVPENVKPLLPTRKSVR